MGLGWSFIPGSIRKRSLDDGNHSIVKISFLPDVDAVCQIEKFSRFLMEYLFYKTAQLNFLLRK